MFLKFVVLLFIFALLDHDFDVISDQEFETQHLRDFDKGAYCSASFTRPTIPHHFKVKQLHVYSRHGDRTPIRGIQYENEDWSMCDDYKETLYLSGSKDHAPSRSFERIVSIPEGVKSRGYWTGNCNPGQLTNRGHKQTRLMGEQFKMVYIDQPNIWYDGSAPSLADLSVRSTDVWRTIQSAQSFTTGLFHSEINASYKLPLEVRPRPIDSLSVGIEHCPRLIQLDKNIQKKPVYRAAKRRNEKLERELSNITGTFRPEIWQFFDTIQHRYCHGKKMPCSHQNPKHCVTDSMFEELGKVSLFSFFYHYSATELKDSRSWPIVLEMIESMKSDDKKIKVYSSHDSTLISLLSTYGLAVTEWPPLASSLSVELLVNTLGEEFIRVMFNGVVMKIGWCVEEGDLCSMNTFVQKVTEFTNQVDECWY